MPFSTAEDSQTEVGILVLQGEREMASDNRKLGDFRLTGIAPAPRGQPKIEVTFDIDANGILHVTAKDSATGKQQDIRITASSGLSKDEVERMKNEAEAHAAEDKTKRELIELRNRADMMSYEAEKQVKEHGEKIEEADRDAIEAARKRVVEVAKEDDATAIEGALEELQNALMKIGEVLYKEQQAEEAANQEAEAEGEASDEAGTAEQDDDNVIDADFTVKN
jgi:molecular chaperone DnaK